jgi:hypothetical protein
MIHFGYSSDCEQHPGHCFKTIWQLHSNSQNDLLCDQLGQKTTSLENELKYHTGSIGVGIAEGSI